jgi:hypothetical protein
MTNVSMWVDRWSQSVSRSMRQRNPNSEDEQGPVVQDSSSTVAWT